MKAADFTAEYGKDYVVEIDNVELAKVDGISPEYSEFMETAQSAASYLVSEEIKGEATQEEAKEVLEALQKQAPENMPVVNEEGEVEELTQIGEQLLVKPSENIVPEDAGAQGSGLSILDQRAKLLGVNESNLQQQKQDVNDVLTQQSDYFEKAQGAFGVLHFNAGQREKSFKIVLIDNDKAEADKVILFSLLGINGDNNATLEANPTMFVSIMDDEEYETPVIVPDTTNIVLDKNNPSYDLVIRRVSGIEYFTTLTVSTIEGSAVPGIHYEALDEVKLSFAPGETEKVVKLSALSFDEDVYYGVRLFSDGTNEIDLTDRYINVSISSAAKKTTKKFAALKTSPLLLTSNPSKPQIDDNGVAGDKVVTLTLDDFIGKDNKNNVKELILRHDGGYSRGKDYDIGKIVNTSGVTEEVFTWETSKNNSTAVILPTPISTYGVEAFSEPYRLETVGSGSYWGYIGLGELGDKTYDRDNNYQRNGFGGEATNGYKGVSTFVLSLGDWTDEAYLRAFVKSTSKGDHDPYLYMQNNITLTMAAFDFVDALSTAEILTPVAFNYNFDFATNAVSFEKDQSTHQVKRYELPMAKLVEVSDEKYSANSTEVTSFYPALDGKDAVAVTPVAPDNSDLKALGLTLDYVVLYDKKGSLLYYPTRVDSDEIQSTYYSSWQAGYTTLAGFLMNPAPDTFDETDTYKLLSGTSYDLNQTFVQNYLEAINGSTDIKVMPHYTRKGVTVKFYTAGGGTTHINNIYFKDNLKTDSLGTYNEYVLPYGSKISFDATVGTKGSRLSGYQIVYGGDTSGRSKSDNNVVKQVGDSTICKDIVLNATEISIIPLLSSEQFKVEYHPGVTPAGKDLTSAVSWDTIDKDGQTTDGGIKTNSEGSLALEEDSVYMGMQWGFRATPEVYSQDGYYTVWQNGTGDLNGNGRIDADEQNANTLSVGKEGYYEIVGNFVTGTLNQLSPKWYYSFKKLNNSESIDLSGTVRKVNASFYDLTSMDEIDMRLPQNLAPVVGATVTLLDKQAATDKNGKFEINLSGLDQAGLMSFKVQDVAEDGARTYYGTTLLQNASIILPAYDTFKPRAISATYADKTGVNQKNVAIKNDKLTISASVRANGQLKPDGVKFYLVTKGGSKSELTTLLGTAAAVSYDANIMTGIITFNPWACMSAGDKIFVSFVDSFGKEYAAIDTGFVFSKGMTLDTFVFGMIGSSTLEGFYTKIAELIGNPLGNIGLGSIGLTQSDPVSLFNGSQTKYTYSAGSLDKAIKSFNGKKESKSSTGKDKPADDKTKKAEEAQDQEDLIEAVKDNGKPSKEKAKYQTSANFKWQFDLYAAFEMTVTQREIGGEFKFCFESLSFAAGVGMDLNASVTVTMPVGFSVMVGAEIKGNLTAIYQLTTDYAGDPEHTKQVLFEPGSFTLFAHIPGTSNVGYIFFNPSLLLNLTLKWTIFSVTGSAKFSFDMRFEFGKNSMGANYTKNYGDVTINLAYDIKVLSFSVYNGNKDVFTDVMFENNVSGKNDIVPTFEKIQMKALAAVGNTLNDALGVGNEPISVEPLSRDYLNNNKRLLMAVRPTQDMSTGTTVVKELNNVYPRSNGKLIDLGDDKVMAIYLGDAGAERKDADRTALYCAIFSATNGAIMREAARIDNGNYPSFYPSVSDLGDGRYAIFWSAADKSLEGLDVVNDRTQLLEALRSLNIKMRIFDSKAPIDSAFSQIYDVTTTTDLDKAIDFSANAVYDATSKKIVVEYTKMDYTKLLSLNDISSEETCETVVAYRIFDDNAKKFLSYADIVAVTTQITGKTVNGNPLRTITAANAAAEDAQWYGQLFVDTRIDRDSNNFPFVVDTASYYYDNRNVAGAEPKGRYVAFAFVVDNDRNNNTVDDRDIYALLFDFATMKYSEVATRLTGKTGAYAQPEFVLRDGEVCLLFAASGDIGNGEDEDTSGIAALNITTILKNGWYKRVNKDNGDPLYNVLQSNLEASTFTASDSNLKVAGQNAQGKLIKPLYPAYILETEGSINHYSLSSTNFDKEDVNNDKICLAWIDIDEKAENAAMQIYTSIYDLKSGVDAVDTSTFSEAFKITNHPTYNYTDCDVAFGKDGELLVIANRAPVASENPDAETSLVLLAHDQVSVPAMAEEDPLTFSTDYIYEGVPFTMTATAKNAGDLGLKEGSVEFQFYYKGAADIKGLILPKGSYEGQIGAGAEIPCTISVDGFDADTLKTITALGVDVTINGKKFNSEVEVKHEADMRITGEVNANVKTDNDTVFDVVVPIRNNGNVAADNLKLAIFKGDSLISQAPIAYNANSNGESSVETKINDSLYEFTETGLGYVELSARILDGSEELASKEFIIYKQFDIDGIKLSQKVKSVSLSGTVKTGVGEFLNLAPTVRGASSNEYDIVWETNKPEVVGIAADGTPYSVGEGNAVLTGTVVPAAGNRVFFDGSGTPAKEDQTQFIPDHLLKTVSVAVKVQEGAGPYVPPYDPPYIPPYNPPYNPPVDTGDTDKDKDKDKDPVVKSQFVDVSETAFYADAVAWAAENGITSGVDTTHFGPNRITSRAEMVTFLWRLAGCPEPTITKTAFTDLDSKRFYYKAALWAVENGITSGMTPTTFCPEGNVNRAQVVTFLWRYSGGLSVDYWMQMKDVESSRFYTEAVRWALAEKITTGTTDTTFSPNDNCLRGQIVTFLYRYAVK